MSMLVITRLKARRLNGFRDTDNVFIDGLQPGLNIVYAPNRAGKTTLTLAYRMALRDPLLGKYKETDNVEAEGEFDGAEVHSTVANGKCVGTMPDSPTAARYVMHLPDLIQGLPTKDRDAAQEALSGYRFDVTKRPALPQTDKAAETATKALVGISNRAAEVDGMREETACLQQDQEKCRRARSDVHWLDIAGQQLLICSISETYPGIDAQPLDAPAR